MIKDIRNNEEVWKDENNNTWTSKHMTKEEALKCSKSLKGSRDCHNCINCINCYECIDCKDCYNCEDCAQLKNKECMYQNTIL